MYKFLHKWSTDVKSFLSISGRARCRAVATRTVFVTTRVFRFPSRYRAKNDLFPFIAAKNTFNNGSAKNMHKYIMLKKKHFRENKPYFAGVKSNYCRSFCSVPMAKDCVWTIFFCFGFTTKIDFFLNDDTSWTTAIRRTRPELTLENAWHYNII